MNALFKNASLITLYNNKGNMAACAVYRKMDGNKILELSLASIILSLTPNTK